MKNLIFDEIRSLPCVLSIDDPGFKHPTRQQVLDLIKGAGWSHIDLHRLLGVSYSVNKKFSSTVSSWTQGDKSIQSKIKYDTWRFMLIMAGIVSLDDHLNYL